MTSKATTDGARLQHRMIRHSSRSPRGDTVSFTPPSAVNLNALDSRFFSTCCRRFESVMMLRSRFGRDARSRTAGLRFSASWRNGRRDHLEQVAEVDFLRIHRHRAGLDLRQVENVADQIQQVGAGAVDGAGEFDLLVGEVAVRILGQLLPQNQNAVERRAQLVRHVGQEFGLVLRGERQLGGLFLHRAPRLLDFLILRLHLDVAVGELLRLLLELLVGLLQLALLGLQLGGELLRLLEQTFGLHRRFDRIQHDADGGRQLFEESDICRSVKRPSEASSMTALTWPSNRDRQHDGIARRRPEQAGADGHHVRRHLGDQHAPRVARALADEPLAELQALGVAVRDIIGVGGQQLERVRASSTSHLIDDAVLGARPAARVPTAACGRRWSDRADPAACW